MGRELQTGQGSPLPGGPQQGGGTPEMILTLSSRPMQPGLCVTQTGPSVAERPASAYGSGASATGTDNCGDGMDEEDCGEQGGQVRGGSGGAPGFGDAAQAVAVAQNGSCIW